MNKIKPDLIVMWPSHLEYPGFRLQLNRDRSCFNKIIIGLNNCNYDLTLATEMTRHLQSEMSDLDIIFVSSSEIEQWPVSDWVSKCIGACLDKSLNEWFLIMQQDFIVHNEHLLEIVLTDNYNVVGRREAHKPHKIIVEGCTCPGEGDPIDARWELDFLLMKRSVLENTSKNFEPGLHPIFQTPMDNLGPLSIEINDLTSNNSTLHSLGFHIPNDFEHLRGFTEGYTMLLRNQPESVILKERFSKYHQDLLMQIHEINIHPSTQKLIHQATELRGN